MTTTALPLDDHGNPPKVRRRHVCKRHRIAYCYKWRCIRATKRRLKRKHK